MNQPPPKRQKEPTHAYVGTKPCGCVLAATVDHPERKEDTAATVQKMISDGLTVERWTVEDVRQKFGRCTTHKPKTKTTKQNK